MGDSDGALCGMLHLNLLPAEILHHIFSGLDPRDLGRLPRTCRFLHDFVKGNQKLCKDVYLNTLDTPAQGELGLDWERQVHDFVRLGILCADKKVHEQAHELPFVYETVDRLLKHASPTGETQNDAATHAASRNAAALARIFREEPARLAFMSRSFIYERARNEAKTLRLPSVPSEAYQRSAKLHCLYGRPLLNYGRTRSTRVYPYAAAKVYDLRQNTDRTEWGPFLEDGSGRVDWEKVEAVMIVLGSNIRLQKLTAKVFANLWERPFAGSWARSYVPSPSRGIQDLDLQDPYGVAGTWLRVVCFVDYNDFFSFNFPIGDQTPREVPRPPFDVGEATRIIVMKVHVTDVQPPGENDGQGLPVVHFYGVSRSVDDSWDENANSNLRVKGTVRLTKEGEVRWTTFSVFNGHARWRSEGIQIGGVGSARGVMGHWFDTDYDPHGPCGPSAFFKVSDRAPNPKDDDEKRITFRDFMPIMDFDAELASDEDDDEDYVVGEWGEDDDDEDMSEEDLVQDLMALAAPDPDLVDLLARRRVRVELVVLARGQHQAVALPAERPAQLAQRLADLDDLALDEALLADGRRAEVAAVDGAGDAEELPVARLVVDEGQGQGGEGVEEGGGGAAVEVAAAVAVGRQDGEGEGGGGVRGQGRREEGYGRAQGAHPALAMLVVGFRGVLLKEVR
ncbi:F-box domain-containing protein [Colletotrichum tofieldiae]|nr:F-box domain-containing protein [Colletotrichum tofieldiae]